MLAWLVLLPVVASCEPVVTGLITVGLWVLRRIENLVTLMTLICVSEASLPLMGSLLIPVLMLP
jgi:hypothetical protein